MSTEQPLSINLDLSQTKVAFPMAAPDTYAKWRVAKVTTDNKTLDHPAVGVVENGVGRVLKIEFDLDEPVADSDGEQILPGKPGAKFFWQCNLYSKTDAKDPTWFVKKICGLVDALLGTSDSDNKKGKPTRPPLNLGAPDFAAQLGSLIIGQLIVAKMTISTFEGTTRSDFKSIHFPADLQA